MAAHRAYLLDTFGDEPADHLVHDVLRALALYVRDTVDERRVGVGQQLGHPDRALTNEAQLELPDGRRLGYTTYGADSGPLVVVLDGPASRGLARASAPAAAGLGIRLVAPDRPGVRASTPAPDRGIADWPSDHAALLDALGAQRAGILSQSGGTPYAVAAAAVLPERMIAIAALGPVAPFDEPASVRELGGAAPRTRAIRRRRRAGWRR